MHSRDDRVTMGGFGFNMKLSREPENDLKKGCIKNHPNTPR